MLPERLSTLLDLLKNRRSIRRYQPEPIPRNVIETLLEAAIWAPSAHNRQPWRFAVVESEATKNQLARAMGERLRRDLAVDGVPDDAIAKDAARSYSRMTGAPVLIALCLSMADMDQYPDERRALNEYLMAAQSVAMAGQNLLLAAADAGLGACWMCAPLFAPDVVRGVLELPEDWEPQAVITLGYPAETRTKTRNPLGTGVVWR